MDISDYILYVYKISDLTNDKIYIGQHHQRKYHKDNYMGRGKILLEKYKEKGIKNFKKEIIEYCENSEELDVRETFWIKKTKSYLPEIGYNIKINGQHNFIIGTESYREEIYYKAKQTKIKNKHKHKYYTTEYKENMSIKNKGENNPNYNNKWSNDKKETLSKYFKKNEIHKGENNSSYNKYGINSHGYKKIPNDILNDIIFDYTNNFYSINNLIKKYNYSWYKIKNELEINKIEISKNGLYISTNLINKIIDMYKNEYLSVGIISKKIGIKDGRAINKILKNNNIKIDKDRRLKNINDFIDNNPNTTFEELSMIFKLKNSTIKKYINRNKIKWNK